MSVDYSKYEAVIGLEVHTQLLTNTKAYSADINAYGNAPNSNISPISLGHPGTLPVSNEKVFEYAVRLGIACDCDITEWNEYARKNYFYADLPKGYQVTQDTTPICTGGFVDILDGDGNPKRIGLTRIHMEEDSGKSIHDQDPFNTLIDLNRAGVPLLEIVTEPEMKSGKEAFNYLMEVRKLVRYLEICDGNMEEGSLRCDANISVMLKGATTFGTKVEVKNMNSMRNVQRAIEHEIKRQIEAVEIGEKIIQDTRTFDAGKGITISMRSKEDAHDYRYFPEPDLQPVVVTKEYIQEILASLPPLPKALFQKYTTEFNLSEYDAYILTDAKEIALYFEEVVAHTKNYKAAANWVMGSVKSYLNEQALDIRDFKISPERLADLINLVDSGQVSNTAASQNIFPLMIDSEKTAAQIAKDENLIQESDSGALEEYAKKAIAKFPAKVIEYQSGKKGLLGLFMGEVMKLSQGKADPKEASKILMKYLDNA
ncbi:MAG: aspartyl-tRNA(Asn)/glutamyl-tRNA(Gln) amidotransferase subunit B [Flavobacteriales bacterium]|jgi:aspartyl-tRNA(Asn)/glutamyl-tRNA(Gln) amidotransferase subunit B